MRKKLTHLILLTLFSSNALFSQFFDDITSSFESYSAYYLDDSKTGDFMFDDRFRSNNYLNLKSNIGKYWNFELQIESYLPSSLLNYSPNFKETNISTFKAEYFKKNINFKIGNFYEQFGSGMTLRSWEDKDLGINNSILGLNLKYNISDNINLTTLIGTQKKGFKYSDAFVVGFDSEFDFSKITKNNATFLIGLSYVGRNDQKTKSDFYDEMTNLISLRFDYSSSAFYSNFEYVNKSKNPIVVFGSLSDTFIKDGSAFLINSGFFNNGFGLDLTFRRLENMSLFSEREAFGNVYNESMINYLPALTKQHDYSLANLYVYSAQPNVSFQSNSLTKAGEIGTQIDLYYSIKKGGFLGGEYGTNLALNASIWNNLDGTYNFNNQSYKTDLLSFGDKYFSEYSIEVRKKWTEKFENIFLYVNQYYNKKLIEETIGKVSSDIFILENTYKINDGKSLRLELQHLSTKDDTKNWSAFGLEYNISSAVSIYLTDTYNYQNPDDSKKIHYYNFGGSYIKGANRYAINYGRQRGGLVCTGGICRYVPESTGFSFSVTTSLF